MLMALANLAAGSGLVLELDNIYRLQAEQLRIDEEDGRLMQRLALRLHCT